MLWSCRVCASTALIRVAALPEPPFDQDEFPAIDFGMWLRMALDWEMAFVAEPLAGYRIHPAPRIRPRSGRRRGPATRCAPRPSPGFAT